ncbi:MAG: hypothetical protein PHS14_14390 [Elusimicrobia bacterium]|nr:hypothetical protein [Elusimicrobiota bacterium]
MMRRTAMLAAMMCLAGAATAGAPASADRAQRLELREGLQGDKRRLKQVGPDQHKELLLIREREKSDLRMAKASAARGETLHAAILEIHEKSRRDRLALRARCREERIRLRRAVKSERDRIVALRQKK